MKACDAVQELLTAHLLEALEPGEEALVGEHLAGCEACTALRAEAELAVALIEAPPVAPPPASWRKLELRLERETMGDDPVRDAAPRGPDPVIALSCSYCRGGLTRLGAVYCASCLAPHHPECFSEHGRCSVMGCAETQVVRPAEHPALPPPTPIVRIEPHRERARWPWALAALVCAGVGGAAAFSLQGVERSPARLASHDREAGAEQRCRIEAHQATLSEVVQELIPRLGRPIEVHEDARELLVNGSWRGPSYLFALRELARAFELELREGRGGLKLIPGEGFEPSEPAGNWVEVDRSVRVETHGESAELWVGSSQRLVGSTDKGVAILGWRRLRVFARDEQVGSTRGRAVAAAWSRDGRRLCYVLSGGLVGTCDLRGNQRDLADLPNLGDEVAIDWLDDEDAVLLATPHGLRKLSVVSGDVLTLEQPSPSSGRFRVHAVRGQRLLVEHHRSIEVWSRDGRLRLLRTFPISAGYELHCSPTGRSAVILTATELSRLDLRAPQVSLSLITPRSPKRGRWLATLAPNGRYLAWFDDEDAFHVDLEDPELSLRFVTAPKRLEGLAWSASSRLALWGERLLWLLDTQRARSFAQEIYRADGPIQSATWAGSGVVLTSRESARRESRVRVLRVD